MKKMGGGMGADKTMGFGKAKVKKEDGSKIRYILQRINHSIFKNPEGLMDNFVLVCENGDAFKIELTNDKKFIEKIKELFGLLFYILLMM